MTGLALVGFVLGAMAAVLASLGLLLAALHYREGRREGRLPVIVLDDGRASVYHVESGTWRHVGTWSRDDPDFPWGHLVDSPRALGRRIAHLVNQAQDEPTRRLAPLSSGDLVAREDFPSDLEAAVRDLEGVGFWVWKLSRGFSGRMGPEGSVGADEVARFVAMAVSSRLPDRFQLITPPAGGS